MDDLAIRRTGRPPSCTCGVCKKCKWAAYMRSYYQSKTPEERRRMFVDGRDPVRVAEREKARAGTPARRESLSRSKLRYPEKEAARKLLNRAVVRGEVIRLPCHVCGKEKVEAHHPDYTKALEVVWYCRLHHVAEHRRIK